MRGKRTYRFQLDAIFDTLDDLLHYTPVIAVRLVIAEPHEPPRIVIHIPIALDDPFIPLYARLFDPVTSQEVGDWTGIPLAVLLLFPLLICYYHRVEKVIVLAHIGHQHELRLARVVWSAPILRTRRET